MTTPRKAFPWRSMVVGALFVITVLNYIDRQTLSILAPVLQSQMSISDRHYAHIVTAFLFAYTLSYLLAGPITDRLGSRRSMTIFALWWSFAEMLPPCCTPHSAWGSAVSCSVSAKRATTSPLQRASAKTFSHATVPSR